MPATGTESQDPGTGPVRAAALLNLTAQWTNGGWTSIAALARAWPLAFLMFHCVKSCPQPGQHSLPEMKQLCARFFYANS